MRPVVDLNSRMRSLESSCWGMMLVRTRKETKSSRHTRIYYRVFLIGGVHHGPDSTDAFNDISLNVPKAGSVLQALEFLEGGIVATRFPTDVRLVRVRACNVLEFLYPFPTIWNAGRSVQPRPLGSQLNSVNVQAKPSLHKGPRGHSKKGAGCNLAIFTRGFEHCTVRLVKDSRPHFISSHIYWVHMVTGLP